MVRCPNYIYVHNLVYAPPIRGVFTVLRNFRFCFDGHSMLQLWKYLLVSVFCISYVLTLFPILTCDCSTSEVTIRRGQYQYVHDTFRRNGFTRNKKFISKDPYFINIHYEMKQNIVWNNKSVCQKNTFILLLFFVNMKDEARRSLIRKYFRQGMIVDGKAINYVFVVASPRNDSMELQTIQRENMKYGDILISIHKDDYPHVTVTFLDAFMWVRDYCKEAVFIGRIDGDVWIHVGNMIHYLKEIKPFRYYGGQRKVYRLRHGAFYKGFHTIPFDFPYHAWVANVGGAAIFSNDVIPFINIGTQYMDILLPVSEDNTIGEILNRAGIKPYKKSSKYILYTHKYSGNSIKKNTIFQHGIKDIRLLKKVYRRYASVYLKPYTRL